MASDRAGTVRQYTRAELERLAQHARAGRGPFTLAQIEAEIGRRLQLVGWRRWQQTPHV